MGKKNRKHRRRDAGSGEKWWSRLNVADVFSDPKVRALRIKERTERIKARSGTRTERVKAKGASGYWSPESVSARQETLRMGIGEVGDLAGAALTGGVSGLGGLASSLLGGGEDDQVAATGEEISGEGGEEISGEGGKPPMTIIVVVVVVLVVLVVGAVVLSKKG